MAGFGDICNTPGGKNNPEGTQIRLGKPRTKENRG
jgi:hypothetical protein